MFGRVKLPYENKATSLQLPVGKVIEPHSGHDDWLPAEELAAITPAKLVERAAGLRELIASKALEAERLRHPVDEVMAALRRTGIFYHFVPKKYGGLEYDLSTYIDIVLPIAEGCQSTAWVTAFCMEHNFLLAQFPEQAQDEIFGSFPYVMAPGSSAPPLKTLRVDGGFRVDGTIRYNSAVMHADWALIGGMLKEEDKPPELFHFVIPMRDATVLDTWHVDGLVATGSHDMRIDDLFVPEHRAITFRLMHDGRSHYGPMIHDSWLYRIPVNPLLALTSAIPAIGAARGTVKFFRDQLKQKVGTAADRVASHMRLGEAELAASTAELILRTVAKQIEAAGQSAEPPSVDERIHMRARTSYAVNLSRHAVRTISEGAGTSAHFLGNPIQRAMRDANMITSHAALEMDATAERLGRMMLGLPPTSGLDGIF